MDLTPQSAAVAAIAAAVDLSPMCGHPEATFTVTRLVRGAPQTICQACFALVVDEDRAARLAAVPVDAELECFSCGRAGSRMNVDIGMGFCDACNAQNEQALLAAEESHVPRSDIVPDELSPGTLYISAKEGAYNRETLRRLGITRVLICCERLLAYHPASDGGGGDGIRYHRLPLADSLAQGLSGYLPAALAFIAQGAVADPPQRTLVHCNAGVSRSGAVAVEWLRRTTGLGVDAALAAAKSRRPIITPNSNFITQMKELPDGVGPVPDPGAAAAAAAPPAL